MKFLGQKQQKLYDEFISKFIPLNIDTYIEPFGGSFALSTYIHNDIIERSIGRLIYNDINKYSIDIVADEIHHIDYKDIFKMYDSESSLFYLDPPYHKKEFYYDGCENYTKNFHIKLRDNIKKLKGKIILSYNNTPFIRNLYSDFNTELYSGNNFIFRNEIIITNF